MTFTQNNTDGFNDSELTILNKALSRVLEAKPGIEEGGASDILNNAFRPGITEDELVKSVLGE